MIRTVDLPCSGCGSREDVLVCDGREHEYSNTTDQRFRVVRCERCGLARLNPRPDVSELSTIYPPNYYAYNLVSEDSARDGRGVASRIVQTLKRGMYQRNLLGVLRRAGFGARRIRLLDIGCADGRLLDWYKSSREGNRLETHGIDMNERAVATARRRGHNAVVGRFEESQDFAPGSFELVLSNHVIEHVADPQRFIERARDLLVPGGYLVLETPNFDSIDVRFFGRHWGGYHFPRHWTFFDGHTLGAFARSVGLEVERVEYQANPIFWNWSFHSFFRERMPRSPWPDRLFPPVGIFFPSFQSLVLLSIFTAPDVVLKAFTGKTASMSVEMRKPSTRSSVIAPFAFRSSTRRVPEA